jgi:cysteine protease ATG4
MNINMSLNNNFFIGVCKTKIYVIYLNCKTLMSYLAEKLSNFYEYDENIYIDGEQNIINIEQNKKYNKIYIFGEEYSYDIKLIKKKIDGITFFCYRENFAPLRNNLTNDIGWGCMVRTGQMMLCNALKKTLINNSEKEIISYFCDKPESPFSIHNITECGEKHFIPIGKWFNPTGIGYTIKDLVTSCDLTKEHISVIIAKDCSLYENEILNSLKTNKPVVLLIPVMLGIDKVNETCYKSLLKCFETKYSLGIVGGRPRQSFYFIGKHDDNIFFLDPHTIKSAFLDYDNYKNHDDNKQNKDIEEVIKYLDISDLDPCMLICFLLKTEEEYFDWKKFISTNINYSDDFAIFSISEKEEEEFLDDMQFDLENKIDKNNDEFDDEWINV